MDLYYTAILSITVSSLIIMEIFVFLSNTLTAQKRSLFACMFFVTMVSAICEWVGVMFQGVPENRTLILIVKTIELSIAPYIGVLIGNIINPVEAHKPVAVLLGVHAIFEAFSAFYGYSFRVTPDGVYEHASLYWVYILSYLVSLTYAFIVIFLAMKKYQYNGAPMLVCFAMFILTGLSIQLNDSSLKTDWIVMTITGIFLYVFNSEMIQQNDALTSLINRRGYDIAISNIQNEAAVIFFDVDNFKLVNDTHGHSYGDYCLIQLSRCLLQTFAMCGKCYRIGGDEFCVIMHTELDGIDDYIDDFLSMYRALRSEDKRIPVISTGYALFDPKTSDIESVINLADENMYKVKQVHKAND